MEQRPSWEANQFPASQEIPHILWNPKVHYPVHKCPPLSLPSTSLIQSIPPHPTYWRSILLLSTHLSLGLPSGLFPSGSSPKPCTLLFSPSYTWFVPKVSVLIFYLIIYWTYLKLQVISFEVWPLGSYTAVPFLPLIIVVPEVIFLKCV